MADATPTTSTTITSNIPEWAQKYATDLLGFGAALTYPKVNPQTGKLESGFVPYGGDLVAGLSPLQEQAMGDLSRMQVSPQTSQATGLTGLAALQAQNLARYNPLQQQQYYQSPYDEPQTGGGYMSRPEQTQTFNAPQPQELTIADEGGQYNPNRNQSPPPPTQYGQSPLQKYMSPYMQGVVEQQKQQAVRDYSRQIPGLQAAGIRAGARGGTREALLQAEGQRGLNEQLQNIQATGLQNAYQQAAQQAAQDAQLRAQYGLAGTQLSEQSRQFGAGLGLQGLQQQLAAAGQLGQLGQQQYQQQAGILGAQLGAGAQQQGLKQKMLESNYQRFIDEMSYPYKQLEFMSNLLCGTPSSAETRNVYTQAPSTFAQISGLTGGLGGLFGAFGS